MIGYHRATGKTSNGKHARRNRQPIPAQKFSRSIPSVSLARSNRPRFKIVLEIVRKLFDGRVALLWFSAQRLHQDHLEIALHTRRYFRRRHNFSRRNRKRNGTWRIAFKL